MHRSLDSYVLCWSSTIFKTSFWFGHCLTTLLKPSNHFYIWNCSVWIRSCVLAWENVILMTIHSLDLSGWSWFFTHFLKPLLITDHCLTTCELPTNYFYIQNCLQWMSLSCHVCWIEQNLNLMSIMGLNSRVLRQFCHSFFKSQFGTDHCLTTCTQPTNHFHIQNCLW